MLSISIRSKICKTKKNFKKDSHLNSKDTLIYPLEFSTPQALELTFLVKELRYIKQLLESAKFQDAAKLNASKFYFAFISIKRLISIEELVFIKIDSVKRFVCCNLQI